MTGVDIVGALLQAGADLVERVPADRMKAGKLPDNVMLPALLVRLVSSVDRQVLKPGAKTRRSDRVAVTVRAASYRDQVEIIELVRRSCAGKAGAIGGASAVAVLTAGTGPDVIGPASSFEQTQDFRVGFDA
jgi:hypothetical protein